MDWESKYSIDNLIVKFGMICDDSNIESFLSSVMFLGEFTSSIFVVQHSDKFGRRFLCFFGIAIMLVSLVFSLLATSYYQFCICYFTFGFGMAIYWSISILLTFEVLPKDTLADSLVML